MRPELPPPDPNEPYHLTPESTIELSGPTAIFAAGPPSDAVERTADAILGFRPGMLIVFER